MLTRLTTCHSVYIIHVHFIISGVVWSLLVMYLCFQLDALIDSNQLSLFRGIELHTQLCPDFYARLGN